METLSVLLAFYELLVTWDALTSVWRHNNSEKGNIRGISWNMFVAYFFMGLHQRKITIDLRNYLATDKHQPII